MGIPLKWQYTKTTLQEFRWQKRAQRRNLQKKNATGFRISIWLSDGLNKKDLFNPKNEVFPPSVKLFDKHVREAEKFIINCPKSHFSIVVLNDKGIEMEVNIYEYGHENRKL